MHMADALISPAVGGAMWAVSTGLAVHSAAKIRPEVAQHKAPLMGVLGAFIFAAQMINFTIPGTGSSGHLAGGMILAILLGPHAAFLVMFSILAVQALFFADGGLLALGCNVFNMGFWSCFVAYPLIFKPLTGAKPGQGRILAASIVSGVVCLQLGPFGVVMQTLLSGISELPFVTFVLLMQPIHLAIGVVEGIVTATLVSFVWKARPEILDVSAGTASARSWKPVLIGLAAVAVVTGGALSWFASSNPDGLEWSMFKATGKEEMESSADGVHGSLADLQKKTAVLPDYDFNKPEDEAGKPLEKPAESWPAVSAGRSVAGLVGGALVLCIAAVTGFALRRLHRQNPA
jgi:cobalt/nickel transport system permease protein